MSVFFNRNIHSLTCVNRGANRIPMIGIVLYSMCDLCHESDNFPFLQTFMDIGVFWLISKV
jgi:hypothetical protein